MGETTDSTATPDETPKEPTGREAATQRLKEFLGKLGSKAKKGDSDQAEATPPAEEEQK